MDIHEYQAKELLQRYGIKSPDHFLITSYEQLVELVDGLELNEGVLKVQVHAGGRGKAGGVKLAKTPDEIKAFGKQMLGMKMVNNQTGPNGQIVNCLILTALVPIKRELYMSIVIDRALGQMTLIASSKGGVDIEEVAVNNPSDIISIPINFDGTIASYHLIALNKALKNTPKVGVLCSQFARGLAKAFVENDATLIEINPLVETQDGELIALDAKMSIDDNALYRQEALASLFDPSQLTPEEVKAKEFGLAYVGLSGSIGCMVNGAGLAMATMDVIKLQGGEPANFLDIMGGASSGKVAEGFKIILLDKKVKAILINIFGGITDCEVLAKGLVQAATEMDVHVPLVVRMEGTNVEQARQYLKQSPFAFSVANSLDEAAKKVVSLLVGEQ